MNKEQEKIDEFFYDQENGFHIEWANHWFGYFYSAYFSFFPFVISGLILRETGEWPYAGLLLLALSIGLGYIPAYRAVFTKDKYLKYFKKFKKKDGNWHKKWMWITIAFCFGSILTGGLGILTAFLVAMS